MAEVVQATLRGMGYWAECSMTAQRSDLLGDRGPAFASCGMLDAPEDLPDGYYEAAFSGHTAFLHKVNGCWNVGIPWPQFGPAGQSASRAA